MIKLLKANSKELETESLLGHEPYLYDTEDENSDAVLPDELPDVTGLDREIVYYLAGCTTFRKKFRLKLCSDCQQMFFVSKEMREFCTPADSDLTQARDHGGLEYVGTAVHKYFCDLEKLVKHFFRVNKTHTWIFRPAGQLVSYFERARVQEMFLEMEFFRKDEKTCLCD